MLIRLLMTMLRLRKEKKQALDQLRTQTVHFKLVNSCNQPFFQFSLISVYLILWNYFSPEIPNRLHPWFDESCSSNNYFLWKGFVYLWTFNYGLSASWCSLCMGFRFLLYLLLHFYCFFRKAHISGSFLRFSLSNNNTNTHKFQVSCQSLSNRCSHAWPLLFAIVSVILRILWMWIIKRKTKVSAVLTFFQSFQWRTISWCFFSR